MHPFAYHRPESVAEAIATHRSLPAARYLAGGMDLILRLRARTSTPSDLIDLARIPGLDEITAVNGRLRIGALASHDAVATSSLVRTRLPALAGLAAGIGDAQVRNRGTFGGAVAVNDPAGDVPAAVLALDTTVETDRRELAGKDLLTGPGTTVLAADEVISAVTVRVPRAAAYVKFPRRALRYALVGLMVARYAEGFRVAVTGAAAQPFRWHDLEAALNAGSRPDPAAQVLLPAEGLLDDTWGSAGYRAHLAGVLARRALAAIRPPQG